MSRKVWAVERPTLRNAGEGLEEQSKQTFVRFASWSLAMFCAVALAFGLLIAPLLQEYRTWAIIACLVFAVFALAVPMVAADRKMDRILAGLKGERNVGEVLKALERQGAYVLHDLRGPIGNIDHVVIHPSGIYAVETKHKSRIAGRWSAMSFDGHQILINRKPLQHDPLPQATRQAAWLRTHLTEALGLTFRSPVRAVVLFPGWRVENRAWNAPVLVTSPKSFLSVVRHSKERLLTEKQVSYFADRLVKSQQTAAD